MSELDSRVLITLSISDTVVTRPGFGIAAIVHEHQQSALARVQTYTSLSSSRDDFPSYTPIGNYMTKIFGQGDTIKGAIPETVKVIKRESAETMTQALDAALLVDSDFYAVGTPSKLPADIQNAAAWAASNSRFFAFATSEADAITTADTDSFSVIQALTNSRAAGYYTADAGGEFTIDSITVAGTTATADVTTFASVPVVVGDTVGVWTSAVSALNAEWTVATVGALNFTFEVPTGTSTDAAASDAWYNYNQIDAAILGKMLPTDAGSRTWDIQNLAGVTVDGAAGTTSTALTDTARVNLGGKNANWFASMAGINVTSGLKTGGGGGKTCSGRYIDIQRGADWLTVNLQLDFAALLIGEGGELGFDPVGLTKVQTTAESRLNEGITNKFLTPFVKGPFVGLPYDVSMPNIADIPDAEKLTRLLSGTEINANIRGKVHNMEAAVTLAA